MKYVPASLPDTPAGGVTAGIDWASEDHAVCIVNGAGQAVSRFCAEHSVEGLRIWWSAWPGQGRPRRRSSAVTGRWSRRCWRRV
jgi:hypothetical protein